MKHRSTHHADPRPPERDDELAELLEEVHRIEVLSRRLVTDMMAGAYQSAFKGAGVEFDEVREYEPGDDPRSIDWSVTARVGRPFVKQYVDEREMTALFVFDASASMDAGLGAWSSRQIGARVAACLAFAAIRGGDKVGLLTFDNDVRTFLPPARGRSHVLRVVRDCLLSSASAAGQKPAGTRIESALEFVARAHRRRAVVFVVSDFLVDDATALATACTACARRHDLVAVRLIPPEFSADALPPVLLRASDPERPQAGAFLTDFRSKTARENFRLAVAGALTDVDRAMARSGVDCIDVNTPLERDLDAIVRPILAFFRMRAERSSRR